MVKIVRCNDLVLHSLVVHLDRVIGIITTEHKQVLYRELFLLAPSNLQTRLAQLAILVLQ